MEKSVLMKVLLILLVFVILPVYSLWGMPANPNPFCSFQPDGTKVDLQLLGDEFYSWYENSEGFSIIKNKKDWFVYAQKEVSGGLAPTKLIVNKDKPENLIPHIKPDPEFISRIKADKMSKTGSLYKVPPTGIVKNLVILCKFSDHSIPTHGKLKSEYEILFNQVGGHPTIAPSGSVKDYFYETSYGQLNFESTVIDWVPLPNTQSWYADNSYGMDSMPPNARQMCYDALDLVDPVVNFSEFDNNDDGYIDAITFIHSGYGAEWIGQTNYIWSHQWSLPTSWVSSEGVKVSDYHTEPALTGSSGNGITAIGVICHETGHFFGLPDLYDTDSSSYGAGRWCVMADGAWGFDGSQVYPSHYSSWCKTELGWITPTILTESQTNISLGNLEQNQEVLKITKNYPDGEYLLVENRYAVGFDQQIAQSGLAIWHIDENKADNNQEGYPGQYNWPENNKHYKVALLQADGLYELEKKINKGNYSDIYHGGGVTEIGPSTVPNTDRYQGGTIYSTNNWIYNISSAEPTMTLDYNILNINIPPRSFDKYVSIKSGESFSFDLDAYDPNGDTLDYIILSLPEEGTLSDPGAGNISYVPYTLSNHGKTITFTPSYYLKSNSISYKVSDGDLDSTPSYIYLASTYSLSYSSMDTPIDIPDDDPTGITNRIYVPHDGSIFDVNVPVNIDHTYRWDLIIELESPSGTVVRLHNQSGGSDDDIKWTYDDEGEHPPDGDGELKDFRGEIAAGYWTLTITDNGPQDLGTLNEWSLSMELFKEYIPTSGIKDIYWK